MLAVLFLCIFSDYIAPFEDRRPESFMDDIKSFSFASKSSQHYYHFWKTGPSIKSR